VVAARCSFAFIAVWIALATVVRATGPDALITLVDLPFALLCHRIPERVPHVFGLELPLCSRCLGLWGGLSLSAAVAWPALSIRTLRVVVPTACALMLLEVVTQDAGLHRVFHPTRLLSGLLLSVPIGGAIGALITRDILGPRRSSTG
jgi:uncharacterized membrane protein